MVHCDVFFRGLNIHVAITFVYAFNHAIQRSALWEDFRCIADNETLPWICLGDFNTTLFSAERSKPPTRSNDDMGIFDDCINYCNLVDVSFFGSLFTWPNKQDDDVRLWAKLDRVLANYNFSSLFPKAKVIFEFNHVSDHAFSVTSLSQVQNHIVRPFKFLNSWCLSDNFTALVSQAWRVNVDGYHMFNLVHKLKRVKASLKVWHRSTFSFITSRIEATEKEFHAITEAV